MSFGLKQTLKLGIPNDPCLLSCYIFKGASDIFMKSKPVLMDDGHADTEDSSGEECIVENGNLPKSGRYAFRIGAKSNEDVQEQARKNQTHNQGKDS